VRHTSQIKHDGRLYSVEIPGLRVPRCSACGELVFDNDADEQIARALRDQLGLLSGEQIRKNRDELGLSQRVLAEHLGVAVETISRWENGALTPLGVPIGGTEFNACVGTEEIKPDSSGFPAAGGIRPGVYALSLPTFFPCVFELVGKL
jgi:putative zinc finger/helix-turn-helix YgiT family protein